MGGYLSYDERKKMIAGITHSLIEVNNSSQTQLSPTGEPSRLRANMSFQNLGADTVYIGGDGVSSSSYGLALAAGGTLSIDDLPGSFDLYAVSEEASCDIAVMVISYA